MGWNTGPRLHEHQHAKEQNVGSLRCEPPRATHLRPLLGRLWTDFLETHKNQSLRLKVLEMNIGGSRASAPEQFESQGVLESKG